MALGIKPSASGLVTHERMTAYIASKGVNELYADSLEALLRAEPANPAEFLADHFAAMTDTVATPAARPHPAPHPHLATSHHHITSSPQWSPPHDTVDLLRYHTSSLLHLRTPPPPQPPPPPLLGALRRGGPCEEYALTLPLSRWRR